MKKTQSNRSNNMRAIRGKDTKMEIKVRRALWQKGYRFRKNDRTLYGSPDISIKKYKLVVFLDSCFWHGCPVHFKLPKINSEFWDQKIRRNIERDAEVTRHYVEEGWTILRFWEHEIKEDFDHVIYVISHYVERQRSLSNL
ncbi:very short patch repair endonuclease [Exiguobacterium aestuarii]|uniref:very short patch repair endonuclease n=1 Tax=Exiguobacterium aestuarii TaxID=273527 RepID=UPI001CD53038|nr:very short patch repair endonuclease [Exiguobacterium aestuarii]MCA0981863.1 very short patch repair endonuclease [Exiguobacterium aestuarii]